MSQTQEHPQNLAETIEQAIEETHGDRDVEFEVDEPVDEKNADCACFINIYDYGSPTGGFDLTPIFREAEGDRHAYRVTSIQNVLNEDGDGRHERIQISYARWRAGR